MIKVKAKNPETYCFVANLASMLLDKGNEILLQNLEYDKSKDNEYFHGLQDKIIDQFPTELNSPDRKRGISSEHFPEIEKIFMDLGLVKYPPQWLKVNDPDGAKKYLLANKEIAENILIYINDGGHCMRLNKVDENGISVMEPGLGKIIPKNWGEFRKYFYSIYVCLYTY